jgi:hypothetical protein
VVDNAPTDARGIAQHWTSVVRSAHVNHFQDHRGDCPLSRGVSSVTETKFGHDVMRKDNRRDARDDSSGRLLGVYRSLFSEVLRS